MRYLARRLGWALVILLGTTTITFAILYVVPGDPARVVAGPRADAATLATIRRELGLDRSLPVQYGEYLWRLAHGDLGRSYATRQPVATTLARRLPATATLACAGLAIAIVVGLVGALLTAPVAGTRLERAELVGSLALLSAPVFWLGMLGLYWIGFRWRLVPLGGAGTVRHLILPALVLGVGTGVYYARLHHTNLHDVL
jgi:peptide/nickel transport system permease protein